MPIREVSCPHCFREVFVGSNAICPACQGNVNQRNVEHDGLTPVEFVDGEELPPVCVVCGNPANCYVKVGEKNVPRKMDGMGIISRILGALGGRIAINRKPEPSFQEYKICVRLPVCEGHREAKTLKPIHIDYRRYRMTVPVHNGFIQRWKGRGD